MGSIHSILICLIVSISDGDTISARCDDQTIKIRLSEIDAPEKGQPFGQKSKQNLSDICFQQQAEIKTLTMDRYGRTVARVICNGTDANAQQVQSGMAWAFTKYLKDPKIKEYELTAKNNNIGLWSDPSPTPPWEWRHNK
ncbi:thermonuclease family protein [Ampullimonas aquatilis]|uniref:thermonuclease family protein n=1 Tax=Ampullimonas aquatilis TaxID=1341549 RepID=UPI003C772C48